MQDLGHLKESMMKRDEMANIRQATREIHFLLSLSKGATDSPTKSVIIQLKQQIYRTTVCALVMEF